MSKIDMNQGAWLKIQESDLWGSVEGVLKLSFDHLSSPSLKKCFAYCAMFPEDFCFEKEQLIELWIAEGFIEAPDGSSMTMMEIGNKYFNELFPNSLFLDVEKNTCGNVLTCNMHDMVHDLAVSVSKVETLIFKANSTSTTDGISHTRHLAVSHHGESIPRLVKAVAPKLHSLFSKIDVFEKMSMTFKSLRVLKFFGAGCTNLKLPAAMGELKHLGYLDVSETSIRTLPRSITRLYNLQTLRFIDCWELTLPDGLRNLISLRHIHFDLAILQPVDLQHLTSLQTLPMFAVGAVERRHRNDELKCLNQLVGELRICQLEHVKDKDEARGARLCNKPYLGKLIFEWSTMRGGYGNLEEVLENLQPHPNLLSLIIRNYAGQKFPSWMLRPDNGLFLLDNLMELELIECINCKSLPP
ncbi:putative disease resistance protein RGA3 [Durio zibethinus]|uniref:Disease resistance protein RGA3 n=1 Tax=Durio zibethinus TaxID=66656 RepID=A0A6P6A8Q6_DURZI|nr:putative disease resistance protein RGA3 [Durio zibethinus]